MNKIIFSLLVIVTIGNCQDFNSITNNIQRTYNSLHHGRWAFVPIAEFPVDSMKTKKVPDLSQGKIWNKDSLGGIVWYNEDTCCVIVKTWNSKKDTTYKFLWFKKSKKLGL